MSIQTIPNSLRHMVSIKGRCVLVIAVFSSLLASASSNGHCQWAAVEGPMSAKAQSNGAAALETTGDDSVDQDYSAELPRFAPLSPAEALEKFAIADGFTLELVASEPLISDPVAIAFDGKYRMYAVEMRGYSEQPDENLGRIALLSDNNADGVMDSRTVFAEGLSWPTAIVAWRDGVLVAAAPDILFFADRSGDGIADVRETWFSGFKRSNVQGLVNSLRWSPRGYIHGATSSAGGTIELSGENLNLLRQDFRIDPLVRSISAATGGGQHGLCFSAFNDKFVTSNSDHLQQVIDWQHWLPSVDVSLQIPRLRRSIAEDGPQATVYRTSPVEPWRLVRTRLRTKGIVPGPVEGGGTAAGYFTGATGTCILDAEQRFGSADAMTALVCDVGSNLIHRKKLLDKGLFWSASRIDPTSELVSSSDTWFRPVQLEQGPDGCIYVVDMYREVIEHPKSLPDVIKKHLDLTSGRDLGRIYRLRRTTSKAALPPSPESLSIERLADRLFHISPWQRMTASRLLLERSHNSPDVLAAVLASIRSQLKDGVSASDSTSRAGGSIAALNLIARIGSTEVIEELPNIFPSLEHPRVQETLLRILADREVQVASVEWLGSAAETNSPRLQIQLARLAGQLNDSSGRLHLLTQLASRSRDQAAIWAIAASAGRDDWRMVQRLIRERSLRSAQPWISALLPKWMGETRTRPTLQQWLASEISNANSADLELWLRCATSLKPQELESFRKQFAISELGAFAGIVDRLQSPGRASSGLWALRFGRLEDQVPTIGKLLREGLPEAAVADIADLLRLNGSELLASEVVAALPRLVPSQQRTLLRALIPSMNSRAVLQRALEQEIVAASLVPPDIRLQLTAGDEFLSQQFSKLFGATDADRQKVVEVYTRAYADSVSRNSHMGKAVFAKNCIQCHRVNGLGTTVGPELKELATKSPSQLAVAIFDPAREVDPRYVSYNILTEDDRAINGIIVDATGQQIRLVEAGGKKHAFLRREIVEMKSGGQSLMPEGLEQQISPQQFVNLVEFLRAE